MEQNRAEQGRARQGRAERKRRKKTRAEKEEEDQPVAQPLSLDREAADLEAPIAEEDKARSPRIDAAKRN